MDPCSLSPRLLNRNTNPEQSPPLRIHDLVLLVASTLFSGLSRTLR